MPVPRLMRRVRLPSGQIVQRPVSPESHFIRTGKQVSGLDVSRTKQLGTRFLGRKWYTTAQEQLNKGKNLSYPLPTFRQRLHGGPLPTADRLLINTQIKFALSVFGHTLPRARKAAVLREVRKLIPGRQLSVSTALREKTVSDIRQMRVQGKELLQHLRGKGVANPGHPGTIYPGLMQDTTGRTYLAKGWSQDRLERFVPIHETVHVLAKLGAIKIDVPFAEAAQRLYALESGSQPVNKTLRAPTRAEFDKKALPEKGKSGNELYEAGWSYAVGDRLGQWVFLNLPAQKRWPYLYLRCMDVSHAQALSSINQSVTRKVA